MIFRLQETRMC